MTELVVDWPCLVDDLRRAGVSMYAAAPLVGISRSQLTAYASGIHTPTHAAGERLIAFWCGTTSRTRESLPMTRPTLSASKV